MNKKTDHDLLIEIKTHVKYIRSALTDHEIELALARKERELIKDQQQEWNTKWKVFVGVASFVGGIIVFIGNKIWELFVRK